MFLVSMLFVPGSSISSAAAQDYEIPAWIMNNAGWWADGAIDDSSFLKGIEYLLDNLIIQIPPNREITSGSGLLQLDKFAYELPKRSGTTAVNISGEFENWSGNQVSIEVVRPDGKTDNISTRSSTGEFKIAYNIKSDFPLGNYQISTKNVMNVELGVISFKLNAYTDKDNKSIPAWVRNNAGWWADGTIDDGSFISGLQFLIKEGIIKVQYKKVDKDTSFAPGIEDNLIMYQTKIAPNTEPFSVIVVYATHNDYCTDEENKKASAYGKMAEYAFKKNTRSNPTQVLAVCMKLDEIKESTYPLVLRELGANRANVMVFIGDIKANFESYIIYEALGWWACQADYSSDWAFKGCGTHMIVVCDECTRPDSPDAEDVTARGMEILVHEIGHHNLFEENFGASVYADSLHNAQDGIDYCNEGGVLESNMCKKLVEDVPIMGEKYTVMNLNFLKNSWKEIDRIAEEDKITNWIDCKISNYENGITGNCVPEISTTQDSSEDNIQSTQRDLTSEQKVPEQSKRKLIVENPRMVNEFFASIDQVTIGQEIGLASDVTHNMDHNYFISFAYAIEIKDDKDTIIENVWSVGVVMPKETMTSAIAWIPEDAGHYTATIYIYEKPNFPERQVMITEPLTLEINVDSAELVSSSTALPYFGAIVELDKIYYSPGDDVNIVITAPNFNTNSNAIEYIGTDTDSKVTIITSEGRLNFYKLKETFPDSGVFVGSVTMEVGYYANTSGTGPWSGKIKVGTTDTIRIQFSNTYSGKVDTVSAQGVVQGGLETSTAFKKYTDEDFNKFSIDYPVDWVLDVGHPTSKAAFSDQYDWKTHFQIFLTEDDSLNNRSDSKVLRAMERNHAEWCDDQTFAVGDRKCSDFNVIDSYTMKTDDNRKMYFVKESYTVEWEDYLPGQEHSMISIVGLIYDYDKSWEMSAESFEYVFDDHSDKIIHMMKSFSLK